MYMATATDWVDDDEFVPDPDELKMPESPEHRRVIDAIGIVATLLLQPTVRVYRDMNWYPSDGGNAVAPDLMVIPTDAAVDRSFRAVPGGPSPIVVVEVPSHSDVVSDFFKKTARYRRLGVTCYTVHTDPGACAVLRTAPGASADVEEWTGRPIEELGGLTIDVVDNRIVIVTPTGETIEHDADIARSAEARTAEAEARTAEAEARTAEALRRAAELEAKLRAAGIAP